MNVFKPTVVVTGVAGNLGLRLLPQLQDFTVIGIDWKTLAPEALQRLQEPTLSSVAHFQGRSVPTHPPNI